ncbi:MAG: hypothetical protein ABIG60_05670 [Patescibacteria group bacterium]
MTDKRIYRWDCGDCGFERAKISSGEDHVTDLYKKKAIEHANESPKCEGQNLKIIFAGIVNSREGIASGALYTPFYPEE